MPNITDKIVRLIHWILRFKQRKGYGIHSPFAFNFVTGVIYEQGTYYAYRQLDDERKNCSTRQLRRKDYRLLMRLANFQRPKTCLLFPAGQETLIHTFLKAGSCHTQYATFNLQDSTPARPADMIVAATNWEQHAAQLIQQIKPGGLLVVVGLKNNKQRNAWKQMLMAPQAQVTFDLRDFGLLFYRPELQREHYTINYL